MVMKVKYVIILDIWVPCFSPLLQREITWDFLSVSLDDKAQKKWACNFKGKNLL